jgi:hypothetical protein
MSSRCWRQSELDSYSQGARPLLATHNREVVTALREIAAAKVRKAQRAD